MSKNGDQFKSNLAKKISDCFLDIPENGRQVIVSKIEEKIPEIISSYADQIGISSIDFAVNFSSDKNIQSHVRSLAKSDSLYAILESNTQEAVKEIDQLLCDLFYKTCFTNEDLNKSLKNAALALGLGAMLSSDVPSYPSTAPLAPQQEQKIQQQNFNAPKFGTQPEDAFLHNQMQIETSGGKNTKHKPSKKGASPGDTAIGRWGLMPNTIREMFNSNKKSWSHPDLQKISSMNNDQLTAHLNSNPDVELHIARALARHVLNRHKGNELKATYAWTYGHNLEPHRIGEKQMNDPVVQKYRILQSGKKLKGNLPASIVMPDAPKFVPKMKKNEEAFPLRLQNWIASRENKDQDNISNTMQQYSEIDNAVDVKKPDEDKDDAPEFNPDDPISRIKMAIHKLKD